MSASYEAFFWPFRDDDGQSLDFDDLAVILGEFDASGDFDLDKYFGSELGTGRLLSLATSPIKQGYIGLAGGVISCQPFSTQLSLEIDVFFVLPEFRSNGVGRSLFDLLLKQSQQLGANYAFVTHTKELLPTYHALGMEQFAVRSYLRIAPEC